LAIGRDVLCGIQRGSFAGFQQRSNHFDQRPVCDPGLQVAAKVLF
jgi:hypothetical protein